MTKLKQLLVWLCIGMFLCGTAHASAGLPMLVVVWPAFWVLLIPMIALKFWYFKRHFQTEPSIRLLSGLTITNSFGVLLGVPLTWTVLGGIEVLLEEAGIGSQWTTGFWQRILSITEEAPWLMAYPKEYYWMIPIAFMVLLIPFFIISTVSEYLVIHRYFLQHEKEATVKRVTQLSNVITYIILYMLVLGWFTYNMMTVGK